MSSTKTIKFQPLSSHPAEAKKAEVDWDFFENIKNNQKQHKNCIQVSESTVLPNRFKKK